MRLIDRYILKEITGFFLLGLVVVTFVLVVQNLLRVIETTLSAGVGFVDVLRLCYYILPPFFSFSIPMALLVAILLGFGRLSGDGEMLAIRASGVSLYQMLRPALILAIVSYAVATFIVVKVEPWSRDSLKRLIYNLSAKVTLGVKERVFTDYSGLIMYVNEKPPAGGSLKGILIFDEKEVDRPVTVFAEKGEIIPDPKSLKITLRLSNGSIHMLSGDLRTYQEASFGASNFTVDLAQYLGPLGAKPTNTKDMNVSELGTLISNIRQRSHLDERGRADIRRLQVLYHTKFALPFACVIFALMAVPLGIQPPKSSRFRGFVLSLLVILGYFALMSVAEEIGKRGVVSPILAVWGPNLLMGSLSMILLTRGANERPIHLPGLDALFRLRVFHRE
jgi:lipopolysaccharide export system permease protein